MASAGGDKAKTVVRFYRFKNRLKEKTVGIGAAAGGITISAEAMAKAQEAFEQMAEDYPDWVSGLLAKLATWHSRCVDTPDKRNEYFLELNAIAHDMQGQGGTFGYPLISAFSESLHGFTMPTKSTITDSMIEVVKAHIDAMRAVIKGRVAGDGGDVGIQLRASLTEAIERYRNRTTDDLADDDTEFASIQQD